MESPIAIHNAYGILVGLCTFALSFHLFFAFTRSFRRPARSRR